jgi:hypothetical protein
MNTQDNRGGSIPLSTLHQLSTQMRELEQMEAREAEQQRDRQPALANLSYHTAQARRRIYAQVAAQLDALITSAQEGTPQPESDPVLAQKVAAYMRNEMAMPDFEFDQEQNWIAGHLFTFAHRLLAQEGTITPEGQRTTKEGDTRNDLSTASSPAGSSRPQPKGSQR